MRKPVFLLLLLLAGFSSCDCWIHGSGYVLDKQTKKPVQNVNVYYHKSNDPVRDSAPTDSAGKFGFTIISSGFCRCKVSLDVHKEGYADQQFNTKNAPHDTLFLEKTR